MEIRTFVLGDLDTNCYVIVGADRHAIIIDPADDAETITEYVRANHLVLESVVLTHAHFDHMLAAREVSETFGAALYVGQDDAEAMTDPVRNLSAVFSMCAPVRIDNYKTLRDGDVLRAGDLTLTVMETPGHTPGCICLRCNDVLFAGDTLFEGSIGRLDFPGGNVEDMRRSLHRLISLPADVVVYPGHGPATTIGAEIAHNPYLR